MIVVSTGCIKKFVKIIVSGSHGLAIFPYIYTYKTAIGKPKHKYPCRNCGRRSHEKHTIKKLLTSPVSSFAK